MSSTNLPTPRDPLAVPASSDMTSIRVRVIPERPRQPKRDTLGTALPLVMVALLVSGCGASAFTVARGGIEGSAVAVDVGDSALAAAIRADCGPLVEHLDPGSEERVHVADLCLHERHFDDAIHAIAAADHALRSAQAVVDAAERAGDAHLWTAAAPCLGLAVSEVVAALTRAGIVLPPEVLATLSAVEAFVGECHADGGGR